MLIIEKVTNQCLEFGVPTMPRVKINRIMKRLSVILFLLIIPIVVIGQNLKALDDKNGFREAKLGMAPGLQRCD